MNSLILADECVSNHIIDNLRKSGVVIDSISELKPGITDSEVIKEAKGKSAILLTEDKDFGEWVFAHKVDGLSVIFIRYSKGDEPTMSLAVQQILKDTETYPLETSHYFVTITKNKVRARKL